MKFAPTVRKIGTIEKLHSCSVLTAKILGIGSFAMAFRERFETKQYMRQAVRPVQRQEDRALQRQEE